MYRINSFEKKASEWWNLDLERAGPQGELRAFERPRIPYSIALSGLYVLRLADFYLPGLNFRIKNLLMVAQAAIPAALREPRRAEHCKCQANLSYKTKPSQKPKRRCIFWTPSSSGFTNYIFPTLFCICVVILASTLRRIIHRHTAKTLHTRSK